MSPENIKVDVQNNRPASTAAADLLWQTLVSNGMLQLPVDIDKIAQLLSIEVCQGELRGDVSGILVKDENDGFQAVINSIDPDVRQRFTLAHEIGHYIHRYQDYPHDAKAGMVEYRNEMSSLGTDPEEVWANKFAAALLMPANIVRKFWAEGRSRSEIAQIFHVSEAALQNRLNTLYLR